MRQIDSIVIHHSASNWGSVDVIRDWHKQRGWNDIGYHFVVNNGYPDYVTFSDKKQKDDWDGKVEEGRPVELGGAHCKGMNSNSIGICVIGSYNIDDPSSTIISSLVRLVDRLMHEYDIRPERVLYHNDLDATACPGIHFLRLSELLSLRELARTAASPRDIKIIVNDIHVTSIRADGVTVHDHVDDQRKIYIYPRSDDA